MKKLFVISIFISVLFSVNAQADCLNMAKGIVSNCLAFSAKSKGDALFDQNPNCLQRRINDISQAWQQFNFAVDSKDLNKISHSAEKVRFQTQYRNEMFNSCWNTMKTDCKVNSSAVDEAISAVSENFCM